MMKATKELIDQNMIGVKLKSAVQNSTFWLVVFLLAGFFLALSVFMDYGVSFDEPGIYNFAPVVIDMYSTAFHPPERPVYQRESFLVRSRIPAELFNYGPFYFVIVEFFTRGLHALGVQTPSWDLWHLAYFLTYEAGIVIFYLLCRRWLSSWASFGAAVLFATQPLIFGHAFINPKDVPFMVFFMATIYSGLIMADKAGFQQEGFSSTSLKDLPALVMSDQKEVFRPALRIYRGRLLFLAVAFLLVVITYPLLDHVLQQSVKWMYSAPESTLLGSTLRVFSKNPENIPVEDFIAKGQAWLVRFELLIVFIILAGIVRATYQLYPKSGSFIYRIISIPFHRLFRSLFNPWVLLAGVIFGLTLSLRLFAPLAAFLVIIHLYWKIRERAVFPSLVYICIALSTTYLSWPYLWDALLKHLIKSWEFMNAFSVAAAHADLPALLATQYTETAILLFVAGITITTVEFFRGKRSGLLFLFLGWTALPLGFLILKKSFLYDNFRQVLFTIPPFFMIAGAAIEKIVNLIRRPSLIMLFIVLIALPGVWSIVKLHPYQYVYYNEIIRGKKSEFQGYNGDYWGTSQKEIVEYLNATVPANTTVQVCSIPLIFSKYVRTDILVNYDCRSVPRGDSTTHYVVITSPKSLDTIPYPLTDVVFSVGREGSIFGVVLLVSQTK